MFVKVFLVFVGYVFDCGDDFFEVDVEDFVVFGFVFGVCFVVYELVEVMVVGLCC